MEQREHYQRWWAKKRLTAYSCWVSMKARCSNPNVPGYHRYGGRGITVCPQWLTFQGFLADMGERPSPEHTLDRINNDGNYEPGNVRWATRKEQSRNRGITPRIEHQGEHKALCDVADHFAVDANSLRYFITERGMSLDEAIPRCRGEVRDFVKITKAQVDAIKSDPRSQTAIAREYAVNQGTISRIKSGNPRPSKTGKRRSPRRAER